MRTTLHHIVRINVPHFVVSNLELSSRIIFEWLNKNYMKLNTGKSRLLLSDNSRPTATINNNYIESEDEQVFLGMMIDFKLAFENHINKAKCPCKNRPLHEYTEWKKNHEVFCNFSIWLLSVNLDVSQ